MLISRCMFFAFGLIFFVTFLKRLCGMIYIGLLDPSVA